MTATGIRARKTKVFQSVFQLDAAQAAPQFAPSAVPGEEALGRPRDDASQAPEADVPATGPPAEADQLCWERAWLVVMSRIRLPTSVTVEDSFGTLASESQDSDALFHRSLALVLDPGASAPHAAHTQDILLWHSRQTRQHFIHHAMPLLAACASQADPSQVLVSSIQTLEAAHRQYLFGFTLLVRGIPQHHAREAAVAKFRRDLYALVDNSWADGLLAALRTVLRRLVSGGLAPRPRRPQATARSVEARGGGLAAREELLSLVDSLKSVGLAGDRLHVLLAETMDACMRDFIQQTYSAVWTTTRQVSGSYGPGCIGHLCHWVDQHYGRLATLVLDRLGGRVSSEDVECWRDVAIGRLATLRIHQLFDIVLDWPDSKGGLDDLRLAVTTPQRRIQLTDVFSAALRTRLLHPGRSTLEILQTYISMIRTFHALDSSKVLLDRVAHALQVYLCQRDDAIRIVIIGLLSDPDGAGQAEGDKGRLVELAAILSNESQQQDHGGEDDALDWNDMSWVPDPVDAGANYRRPKSEDVIGTLISALGSQAIFIKEFELIVAERLLSKPMGFEHEEKVLSLLKKRFGDGALQNCDVMVKDIYDSRRIDDNLTRRLRAETDTGAPAFHSKILSRLFWPSLRKEGFKVPAPVAVMQRRYEAGFEQLKTWRKLSWLDHLGSAVIRLELEERVVELQCKTYEAAVIYEFHDDDTSGLAGGSQRRTLDQIRERLMMDDDLVALAVEFWVTKRVLRKAGQRTYEVLERLGDEGEEEEEAAAAAAAAGNEVLVRKPGDLDSRERERRAVYWQFIVGMLTNSSPAMPLGQILMMMKMLVPDGCPWSNEELQEFLAEKVVGEELELAGGKYRLVKK